MQRCGDTPARESSADDRTSRCVFHVKHGPPADMSGGEYATSSEALGFRRDRPCRHGEPLEDRGIDARILSFGEFGPQVATTAPPAGGPWTQRSAPADAAGALPPVLARAQRVRERRACCCHGPSAGLTVACRSEARSQRVRSGRLGAGTSRRLRSLRMLPPERHDAAAGTRTPPMALTTIASTAVRGCGPPHRQELASASTPAAARVTPCLCWQAGHRRDTEGVRHRRAAVSR
jgi:hypothetical protein